jgi:hypothetical protein
MLAILLLLAAGEIASDSPKPVDAKDREQHPCRYEPRAREMDFWIGEWEVRDPSGAKLLGTSSVTRILDGCALFEQWRGARGHEGKSFTLYEPDAKEWRQTYVDDTAAFHEYHGAPEDGSMRFLWKHADGSQTRMVFTPMPDGTVRQLLEESKDGAVWQAVFDGRYHRKPAHAEASGRP